MSTSAQPQTEQVTPERLLRLAWSYALPLAIESGVRLGIFDILDQGKQTAAQIASATKCSLRGTSALLDLLAGFAFLEKSSGDSYALTPESLAFLVSTKPGFLGGMFRHTSGQLVPKWLQLTQVVQTGKPAIAVNGESDGSAFFETFVEDLFPMNYPSASALAEHLGIGNSGSTVSVLDLAAGSGVWGIAMAQASPNVKVQAVDWPRVLDVTRRVTKKFGVADRYTYTAGDLSEADFGTGHQVAILGHILHSEGEERGKALLKKTFQALAPGGTIAIAEFLVNQDRTGPVNGLIFAVNMLVNTADGNTYSFEEIRDWLQQAGFENARQVEARGPSPLILADRPAA